MNYVKYLSDVYHIYDLRLLLKDYIMFFCIIALTLFSGQIFDQKICLEM